MTVLQVKSLCVKDVVHDVAFSIAPGERVGLIGESGSGKTLTAMSVMRLIRSSGEIRLSLVGSEMCIRDSQIIMRQGCGA